jgi:hypothetical protein
MKNRKYSAMLFLGFALAYAAQARTGSAVIAKAAAAGSPLPASSGNEAALRQLNEKLLTAYGKGDVKTLDQIEGDDFTLSGDFGTVTKPQQLDHLRNVGGQPEPVNRQITPQQIRFYGEAALITETDHASGSGGKSDYQTTSMWVRSGATWRIVHMHYSKLAEK